MSENNDICKGCNTYNKSKSLCTIGLNSTKHNNKITMQCPCVDCIVKTMCRVPCHPFHEFVRLVKGNIIIKQQKGV